MKLKAIICSVCALTLLNVGQQFVHADDGVQKVDNFVNVKKAKKVSKKSSKKSSKVSKKSSEDVKIQKVEAVQSIKSSNEVSVSKLEITTNVEAQQKSLSELDSELKSTSDDLNNLKDKVINGNASQSKSELLEQKSKVDELQKKLEDKQKELADKLDEASKQLDERKTKVNEMLRNAQSENANSNILNELLNSESLGEVFRKNVAMKNLTDAQVIYTKDTEKARKDLQDLQNQLNAYTGKLEELKPILEIIETQIQASEQRSAELAARAAQQRVALRQASTQQAQKQTQATNVAPNKSGNALVDTALSYLGVPYVWGGRTPSGFDCSGFMQYVYHQVTGREIGSWTVPQERSGSIISVSQAQPGDLLFYGGIGSSYHVGMYIGNGQMVHAPQPGDVVKITNLSWYYPSFAVRPAI